MDGLSQCSFEGDVIIEDKATTSIPIFICGAANDDLGSNNCLQAVTIHFKHEFIGDIVMELVSPSGQSVTLVGPSQSISASTSLVLGWDIQFFAESLVAVPDAGYDPVWNNLQTWLGFTTYVGKYYPHEGKLEDFDTGPVNGSWTLNIMDNVDFGEGHIYCLGLTFCNEDGIEQKSCNLTKHTLTNEAIEGCPGDLSLNLDIEPEFQQNYDPSIFGYSYLLFKDNEYQSIVSDLDLTSYETGNYTICGLLYDLEDFEVINDIAENDSKNEIESYIFTNGLCASFSDDCLDITILPLPEVVTESMTICVGDTISINGIDYTETGVYDIISPTLICDSLSILDLSVVENEIVLVAPITTLSCENPILKLDASMSNVPMGALKRWKTEDGNFLTSDLLDTVNINRPGTYSFRIFIGGCLTEQDIVIDETEDFATIDYSSNILTCTLDSTFIDIDVSDSIESILWTGPFPFSELDEDIRVANGGTYTVSLTTNLGCEISQEIEVIEERQYPELTIEGDTLSCTQLEVLLNTTPMDTLGSTFQWYNDDGNLTNDTLPYLSVSEVGLYSIEVTTSLNCIDTFSYNVTTIEEPIVIDLITDSIDCLNLSAEIGFVSESEDLDVIWILPDGEVAIEDIFSTSQTGEFQLTVVDSFGCSLDTSLMVIEDFDLPDLEILEASFLCGDDSIQLLVETIHDDLSYSWTRPDGIIDINQSPYIFSPGTYFLEACRPNGCCVNDTIIVGVDVTVPLLDFEFNNLDCNNDTVYIIPSDTMSFQMEWKLDDLDLIVTSNIIEVTEPGFYEVTVTNIDNGCNSKFSFNIERDIYNEIDDLSAMNLNCANEEVRIMVSLLQDMESFVWTGPGLLDNDLQPRLNQAGVYVIDYVYTNGCTGKDSIEIFEVGEFPNLQGEDKTITCFDEFITLEAEYSSSSITLSWTGPDNFNSTGDSIQVTTPGIYTATGIAPGSCKDTLVLELFDDTISPMVSISGDGEITCVDSLVLISSTVDSNTDFYKISGPGVIDSLDLNFEVTIPGLYTMEAVGFNGCQSIDTFRVYQSTDFPDYVVQLDTLNCVVNSVAVGFDSSDPNLSVEWEGPMNIDDDEYAFTTSQAGNYVFSIVNEFGCSLKDSFFVLMDTLSPNTTIQTSSQINCLNEFPTLSIANFNNQFDVNWVGPGVIDPNEPSFSTSEVGNYILTVEAPNGCISIDTFDLVYDTLSPEILVLGDPINCSAGKTFLSVESDLLISSYEWTGPNEFTSTDSEPLVFQEGMYFVTVIAENGCISSDSIDVEDERVFPEIEIDDFYLPCDGTEKQIYTNFISEGSSVRWFGPNDYFAAIDTALVLEPGEYIGIAFNEDGCTASDTFQVLDIPILPEFSGSSELLLCFGPVSLTAEDVEDDGAFYWTGPNDFYSEDNPALADEPGIYQLIVTTTNGCTDSLPVELLDGRIFPEAVAEINEPFQCNNLEVNLSGLGSSEGAIYSYQWTTSDGNIVQGANTLSPRIDNEGTYILEVTNENLGCSSRDSVLILIQEQGLQGAEIELIEPTCLNFENAEINLTQIIGGFSPFNVFVDDFDYGERTNIQYLSSGEHLVTIIDSLGCQHDTLVMIPDNGVLQVDLPLDTTICFGDSFLLQPTINLSFDSISSIIWSSNVPCNGCDEIQLFVNETMDISIEVTDINGCIVEKEFTITVDRPNNLPFPQIFSPNGDGINDVFYMPMTKSLENIDYMKIYDNWGGLLFSEQNLIPGDDSKGWRGTIDGKNVEIGVYIVEAVVTLVDGSQVTYVGDLTLVR